MDTGLFSGFVTIERCGKWLTDINLLLILFRQMAALVRRALAEACSVPVLLVLFVKLTRSHAAKYRANTLSLNPFSVSLSHLPCRYVKFSV